jgi:hypothetical protein
LADWLRSYAVTVVGMESTGVYWRAVYYLLEDEFQCRLYNAHHLRHVPGRKRTSRRPARPTPTRSASVPELADGCRGSGVWLHVDAATRGFAAPTNRGRRWLSGIEQADSVTLEPHKRLYQPF